MNVISLLIQFARTRLSVPMFLLSEKEKINNILQLRKAALVLKQSISEEVFDATPAGEAVKSFLSVLAKDKVDECDLAKVLVEICETADAANSQLLEGELNELKKQANLFLYQAMHHKVRTEKIEKSCKNLDPAVRRKRDREVLQMQLVFYVLEYTLQVAQDFKHLNEEKRRLYLDQGLKTKDGNLPGLRTFMEGYKEEGVYSVCDQSVRNQLVEIFLKFEKQLKGDDLDSISKALDEFNRELLKVVVQFGIFNFKGLILKPYPDNTPIQDIIAKLSK